MDLFATLGINYQYSECSCTEFLSIRWVSYCGMSLCWMSYRQGWVVILLLMLLGCGG